jgi:beta-glucosidase
MRFRYAPCTFLFPNSPSNPLTVKKHRLLFAAALLVATARAADPAPAPAATPAPVPAPIPADAPYKNAALPVDERVKDLLSRMTLQEKVRQLAQNNEGVAYCNFHASTEQNAATFAGIQKRLLASRLGIPALTGNEGLHGLHFHGCTIYPQAIALGSTWNTALVKKMGAEIAAEASVCGVNQVLAPVLDLGRDPRYGRIEECYGECPTLVSRMGVAYITGLQGDNAQLGLAPDKVFAMTKHFAGYSVPANGINIAPALIGEREMRTLHLIPFEAAVKEAHVMSLMPGYNSVDGVPLHANPWLLTDVLRKEWGFQGYIYSDWGGIDMLGANGHRVAASGRDAGLMAFRSGVDVEAPTASTFKALPEMVKSGALSESSVDAAAGRVLRAKFLTGLFDGKRPDASPARIKEVVHCAEHIATSRALADESIILLKNEKNLLPLDITKLKSIALIGPSAAQVQFGDYVPTKSNKDGVHLLGAMKAQYDGKLKINYAKGCSITGLSKDGFAEAVKAAEESDVAVVVIGDTSIIYAGVGWEDPTITASGTVGEGCDVSNPVPPGVQEDLVKAIAATGKPVIVVLLNGRPYCLPWMHKNIPAIVEAFYPGERQGDAIADILFGKVNPSGHLPVTLARSAGHIPCTYDYKGFGRGYYRQPGTPEKPGRDYVFDSPAPLWPFGFGLSYTNFTYTDLKVTTPAIPAKDGVLKFTCAVKNTGKVAGKAVPQIYWRQGAPNEVAPPEKRLMRFEKVSLAPGESRELAFEIPVAEFRALTRDNRWIIPTASSHELQLCEHAEAVKAKVSFKITQ